MKSSQSSTVNKSSSQKLAAMREGGAILAQVRRAVVAAVAPGVRFEELEAIAQAELKRLGAKPSFPTVKDYKWATCITKNEGCCHGIPEGKTVNSGDLITVDVGALYKGFHTDTSITVPVGKPSARQRKFLEAGKASLKAAIAQATPGKSVFDISAEMQRVVEEAGYKPIYQLTGHGIGEVLHMEPNIPCYADERSRKQILQDGQTIAIEIMYSEGNPTLVLAEDGWTYETKDKSLTGMFEHTVIVRPGEPEVITDLPLEKE